jgi:hypothetical protein
MYYGLQKEQSKCETVGHYSNKPIHPMDTLQGSMAAVGVVRAVEMLENELKIQRSLIGSLVERLDQYTDKADLNAPTSVEAKRAARCVFEQRIYMSLDNAEVTNTLLRLLIDRVQL